MLALAAYGAVLLVKSSRADEPVPKGRLVVAAMVSLGLVLLLVFYALPNGCNCLP